MSGLSDEERIAQLKREAAFGLAEIGRVIARDFPPGKKLACLEVGSSLGFLQRALRDHYPEHRFEGLEPIAVATGFAPVVDAAKLVAPDPGLNIHPIGYEDFRPSDAYDLIFSVNVIEHIATWQDYLRTTYRWLAPGGVSVVLCANYAFPWESHFHVPLVFGKAFSGWLSRGRIAAIEAREGCIGLWDGLSFVKKSEIGAFLRREGISFAWDEAVMARMAERLFTDPEFAARHWLFGPVARTAHRLGLMGVMALPPLNRIAPYMMLRMVKPWGASEAKSLGL